MNTQFSTLYLLLMASLWGCHPTTGQRAEQDSHRYTNELVHETSPYLLQHAHNPVNWYPWGEKALEKAEQENKLLIISVGYAACHWCHVMEHESFEDTTVSRIMNEHFVSIKVDREERPDIDNVYMAACQMASEGSCGWPLNAFALPDGRPVWAGTYFPKKNWMEIMEYFVKLYQEDPQKLESYATQLVQGMQQSDDLPSFSGTYDFNANQLSELVTTFVGTIDEKRGGRVGAPKFPMPNNYEFLLDYHFRTGNPEALQAVLTTLDHMAMGGIYDQLGGGFHRYSTDDEWKVPHFEKMLYDNAQLVSLYAKAYKLTKNPLYKTVVEETLTFIERELTDPSGGFYSSLDADSEGEEGTFYLWDKAQIDSILGTTTAAIFNDYYDVRASGNWEGRTILLRKQALEKVAQKHQLSPEALTEQMAEAKQQLLTARSQRIRPGLDDKILTAWNALMLEGYVDAYQALGEEAYLQAALKNARFIVANMLQADHRLNRNYKDGKSSINAFLDDYALTSKAFVALYEVTFDEQWLTHADQLVAYALAHFRDGDHPLFNYTSDLDPDLVANKKELADNVIPGSNSAMSRSLHLLGLYLYNEDYLEQAQHMMATIQSSIVDNGQPSFFSNWLQLYTDLAYPPYEVAILGSDYQSLQKGLLQTYQPNAILLGGASEGSLALLKDKLVEGETMIYVCQNKVCKFPVETVDAALELMR